jgi:hypothetical protein
MRVVWTVKIGFNIYKDGELLQSNVPANQLQNQMSRHHVDGANWDDLWSQLGEKGEGTVVIDPWPPATPVA